MDRPAHSQVSPRTVWTVGLNVLAIVALGLILYQLRPMLALLAISLMLGLALDPLVRLFQRLGLSRGWGVLLTLLSVMGLFGLVGLTIVPMMVEQVSSLVFALPGFIERVSGSPWLRSLDQRFGLMAFVERELLSFSATVAGSAFDVLSYTLGGLVTGLAVLTLSVFGLLSGGHLFDQGLHWMRPDRRADVRGLIMAMREAVSGYLVGVFLVCALGSVVTGVTTYLFGVPYFLALGMLYLVLGFIPYIGSLIVAITVSLTTLATVGFRRALIVLVLFLVYQQIEGNVVQPLIQRQTLKMNPLLIAIVVIIGAMLMGVLGGVLALPVAAALQVVLQRVQRARSRRWEQEARPGGPPDGGLGPPVPQGRQEELPFSEDSEEPLPH
ncbi:AI-2E family transporter [Hyalangium rubrum]|uniref:AI-2E family transporter n=1 Tax=Hyalangium rubrum TaxID=3103134 RepID=A0ABU5H0E9_9BACT|nr:AI-2E family transporter [Hyalangium sp. s54d21]MDY7226923.1 AI-2E family transporter [Hyalangium sp. s54d21]